jgi:hypothetical protein
VRRKLIKEDSPAEGAKEGISCDAIESWAGHSLNGIQSLQDWQLFSDEGKLDSSFAVG